MNDPTPVRRLPAFVALLLVAAMAPAQAQLAGTAFGVRQEEGLLRASGPSFGATFTSAGVEFLPVLGAHADKPEPVHYRWTQVQRGGVVLHQRERDTEPEVRRDQVVYRHDQALHEVYDVRQDGIEQSFVFHRRLPGSGDLVVRGEIRTGLEAVVADERGVKFALPTGAGVSFGAVTGVDANGATAAGSLRLVGTMLELSLPAAFVDAASYPLVLDPLIGSVIPIGDVAGQPDRVPSVAYDEATNRYLVAWSVQYATSSWEVRGQIVSGGGAIQGAPFTISAPGVSTIVDRACVASVRGVGRFVVAMRGLGTVNSLSVRSVSAANGSMAAITPLITSPTLNVTMATVGGDSRVGGNNALVGYVSFNLSNGSRLPHTTMLTVTPAGTFTTVLANNQLAPNSITNPEIAVSRHGGLLANWLTAWTDQTGSGAMRRVQAQVIGPTGIACAPVITQVELTNSGAETVSDVACATRDGTLGLVSWTYSLGGSKRVHARVMVALGVCGALTTNVGGLVVLPAGTGLRDRPAVDFAADKFVLAFRERQAVGGQARVVVLGLDLNNGTPAGAEHYPDGWLPAEADPAVAAKWSGGATADDALVAWSNDTAIRGHRFEATGAGTVTPLGGGCGYSSLVSNFHTYNGLPTLGTTFSIEIDTPTFPVLALIIGFSQAPFVCGPCTVVPSGDLLLAPTNPTVIAVPNTPALIGAELFTQWLQWRPSGCSILPDLGFTNALKFTIAE